MTTIPTREVFDYLADAHDVPVTFNHTGGGNWVAGIGAHLGYDEEQGADVYDVNVGPLYRDTEGFTGEGGDLYLVSRHPAVPDVTVHVAAQLLPTLIRMLGIDDVTIDDPTVSLADVTSLLGNEWRVGCLGGNTYGAYRESDGTIVTLTDSRPIVFAPAELTIGRQAPTDDEWQEVWSGHVWSAEEVRAVVADHA